MEKDSEMRWNLDDIVSLDRFDALYSEVEERLKRYDSFYSTMVPAMTEEDFRIYVEFEEETGHMLNRLSAMPSLMIAADQRSENGRLLEEKAKELYLKYDDASRKISHWQIGKEVEGKVRLDDENAKRIFSAVPGLEYVLSHSRESARYILSEAEEKLITQKDMNGVDVLVQLRDIIETEMKYFFKPKGAKRGKTMATPAQLGSYVRSAKPEEREAAYTALLSKYNENLDKFFMIYQAVVKDWCNEARLRGYKSSISMRNHENHVPDDAIETLLEVCTENRTVFQDYFRFKARELGMEKLRRFDLYAPLESKERRAIPLSEAVRLVLDAFSELSPEFAEKAKMIIDSRHIDSHPRPNKSSGAFCATVSPDILPYLMLNYTDTESDVGTLAHELGHGVHSQYARPLLRNPEYFNLPATLPLCETASTLGEMIVFERRFEAAENDEIRKAMLSEKLAGSFATVLRQSYFVKFEILAHEAIQKGVTAEELSDIYFSTLQEQFGDAVDIDPIFRYEWAYIPHIVHTPFYCYAYNFGELLSLALYARYKKEGSNFVPKIERILESGGSKSPREILSDVGIDMCSREFWQGSFDIIKEWQKKLERY